MSSPFVVYFWQPLDARGWALMFAVGISFGAAQLMMIRGFAHAPAALLAPLSYVQIVSATIFSVAVFPDIPDVWTLLAIVMLIGSGIYVVRRRAVRPAAAVQYPQPPQDQITPLPEARPTSLAVAVYQPLLSAKCVMSTAPGIAPSSATSRLARHDRMGTWL